MGKKTNENKKNVIDSQKDKYELLAKRTGQCDTYRYRHCLSYCKRICRVGKKQLPQGVGGMRYYVEKNEDGGAYEYIIEGSDEKKYRYDVKILWDIIELPGIILLGMETIVLFVALFRTADVRRRLSR